MTKVAGNQDDFVLLLFISFYCVPEERSARFRRKSRGAATQRGTRVCSRQKAKILPGFAALAVPMQRSAEDHFDK